MGSTFNRKKRLARKLCFSTSCSRFLFARRNHPDIDADIRRAADALEVLPQESQQLRLQRGRHLADFVEKDRAAVSDLQQPFLLHGALGKGAALVPETALQQLLRQCRAGQITERPRMNRASLA